MAALRPVASLRPSARLLVLALGSGSLFFLSLPACIVALAGLLGLCLLEGLNLARLAKESTIVLWMAALAFGMSCLSLSGPPWILKENLESAGLYSVRLGAAYLAGRLFYAATSATELREAAFAAGRLLPKGAGARLALAMALVLGFIPRILEEWRSSQEAAKARGYQGGLGPTLEVQTAFLRRLMVGALDLPEALAARGWYEGELPPLKPEAWRTRDWLGLGASAASLGLGLAGLL